MQKKKLFIVWDCDLTISDVHTMFFPAKELFGEEIQQECIKKDKELWSIGHEYFLNLLRERKIPKEKLNEAIDKIPLCNGIEKSFEAIKKNRDKCKCIILTSNLQFLSEEIMRHLGYYDIFDAFVGCREIETKNYEKPRIFPNGIHNECQNCKPNPCKVNTLKEYQSYNPIESPDDVKVFVCDGGNDLCFAKTLGPNDYVLARKGYGLLKRLDREKCRDLIKANLIIWENGDELAKKFEEIIKEFK